jgi:16S rRNA (cytosine967-C5)-methyltransferase
MLTPAREAAFKVLMRVEREASYATELLNSRLAEKLSSADRGLAEELTLGCLRWQAQLDWLAACFSGKPPAGWDAEVRIALRLGIYQLRFLDRIPPSAAVDQSVELVKRVGKRPAAGLVNAVLRKVTREPLELLLPAGMSEEARRAIELSHPAWLLDRWRRSYGAERAAAIARANNQAPHLFVRVPPGATIEVGQPCRYVRRCRDLTGEAGRVPPGFIVQDEASQIVSYLLAPASGQRVLDLCAAPGIKTGAIQELAPGARLLACDLRPARLRVLRRLAWRQAAPPDCVALDGTRPLPFRVLFDRILVDAPCSGTGTIRRNPEIKWRLKPSDLPLLAARQRWLLSNALDSLAPGGRLVYSTCSMEPEENQDVVEAALKGRNDCCLTPVRQLEGEFLSEAGQELLNGRYFQSFPDQGMDGFFAAVIDKE